MLNKNQSKKWNFIKYALVIPVLVAFVLIFQMEVIAKEKHQDIKTVQSKSATKDVEIYKIDKNTSEAELKEKAETISKNFDLNVHFSKTKRNANNELIAIAVEVKKGKEISENRTVKSTEPIRSFAIIISKDENGKLKIYFAEDSELVHKKHKIVISDNLASPKNDIPEDTKIFIDNEQSDKEQMEKLDSKEIDNVNVIKNSDKNEIRIITKKHIKKGSEEDYFINDEKVDKDTFNQTDSNTITRMDVNTDGKKTIRIITKNNTAFQLDKDAPVPPTPPTPPVLKFKAPAPPALPKAPKAPKGDPIHGDKKAWDEFEKQMEEFDAKMKKMEPQMDAFNKKMEDFDKQMEPFHKEMKAFDEKMKVYQKELEKYMTEKNAIEKKKNNN